MRLFRFQVLGKNQKYIYKLTFHAKPPKLTVIPRSLKGDDIPVLTVYKRYILIKNESPTIAKFHITQVQNLTFTNFIINV